MIFILTYIFGVGIHSIMKDEDDVNADIFSMYSVHFRRITDCMWILLVDGTFMLDGTGDILTRLYYMNDFNAGMACVLFITFLFLSAMVICNMLIGVLCEVVAQVAQSERDSKDIATLKETMLNTL